MVWFEWYSFLSGMIACEWIVLLSHYQRSLLSCHNVLVTVFYVFYTQDTTFFWLFPHHANFFCHPWYLAVDLSPDHNNENPVPALLWYLVGDPNWECKQLGYRQNCINHQKNVMIWQVVGKIVNSFLHKCHYFAAFFIQIVYQIAL